jgi:hypothetical protein
MGFGVFIFGLPCIAVHCIVVRYCYGLGSVLHHVIHSFGHLIVKFVRNSFAPRRPSSSLLQGVVVYSHAHQIMLKPVMLNKFMLLCLCLSSLSIMKVIIIINPAFVAFPIIVHRQVIVKVVIKANSHPTSVQIHNLVFRTPRSDFPVKCVHALKDLFQNGLLHRQCHRIPNLLTKFSLARFSKQMTCVEALKQGELLDGESSSAAGMCVA